MTAVLIFLVLVIGALGAYLIWRSSEELPEEPVDPEKAMQAAVDLHRIRRRLDVADLKHRERREARQLKCEIAEAFDDEEP